MKHVARVLDVQDAGAVTAVQELLWTLMDSDVVQGLLLPMQARSGEAPAPTLVKSRDRLKKSNPLAPVMTINSAKIVSMLLCQESGKRLAAVVRPCEVRALVQLEMQGRLNLDNLVTVSIDCLGSHDEGDYEERVGLWGDDVPTLESLRWSRKGQIAPYRFRRACQICLQPNFDSADITIGLLGQNVVRKMLVLMEAGLAERIGLCDNAWTHTAVEDELTSRRNTIRDLVVWRKKTRERLMGELCGKPTELGDLLATLRLCTLCGACQEACPLTSSTNLDMGSFKTNTPEYFAARVLDLAAKAETCSGCGMCESVCHRAIPLTVLTQMLSDYSHIREELVGKILLK